MLFSRESNKSKFGLSREGGVVADNQVLELKESLDISVVEKLYESLNDITQIGDSVRIGVGNVERIDTAAMQLLYSYQQSMDKKHTMVSFVGPSKAFMESLTLLGMQNFLNIEH